MRRALLTVVTAAGLAIGTVMPTSALGLTQVTLNCDDGTTWTAVVDTDTLTGLVAAVQAMLDYPAGLTCTLIQVPVVTVGAVALAGSGNDPFIVGGGRWQVPSPCESPPHPLDLGEVAKVPGALSYEPIIWSPTHATTTALIFVNIAVNVHQASDGTFFGTLNETIPNQSTDTCTVRESHFTSKPTCLFTAGGANTPRDAAVTSHVTQTSGATFMGAGPDANIHFSFQDNGNPPQGTDMLQGPPLPDDSTCVVVNGVATGTFGTTLSPLANGNISIRNAQP